MEIVSNTGMAYQGSTPQTDNKISMTEENTTSSQAVETNDYNEEAANAVAGAMHSDQKEEMTAGEVQRRETIKRAVEEINKKTNTEAIFGIHDKTNRITIKIVDKESKKVLKEYPPEQTLDMIAKVWEMAGILVDEKR